MKRNRLFILLAFFSLSVAVVLTACKKDKDDDSNNQTENLIAKSYFTIENSGYQNAAFPAESTSGNAPVIDAINGNTSILEGGSNPISINTTSTIKEVLIGVQGIQGYYTVPANLLKSTNDYQLVVLLFSQTLEKESFVIVFALRDNAGLVSAWETITVTRITAGTGTLQVSCSWDQPNDVDLHLVEPNTEEIYYGMEQSANGGILDIDSNAGCYLDYVNNENITYSAESIVEGGNYIVRVDLYSNCDVPANTNFSVTARYQGNLIAPASGSNPYTGSFTPADEDGGDLGSGRQVMTFNIPTSKSMSPDQKALKFVYSKRNLVKSPQKMR
jgi:hypothetical protein